MSASGGTHRVRGVIEAVHVLSPVESSSPPRLYCTTIPFYALAGNLARVLLSRGEASCDRLLHEHAFAELVAANEHLRRAVAAEEI